MKNIILRYGLYAALSLLVLGAVNLMAFGTTDFQTAEVLGYLAIFVSMIFVFFGIRHFRDSVNGGMLTFGQGLKVGSLIVLIAALLFGLFDTLYVEVINPQWQTDYYNYQVEQVRNSATGAELDEKLQDLETQRKTFDSPLVLFLVMAVTVFVIGFIVTIISTLALRRKPTVA